MRLTIYGRNVVIKALVITLALDIIALLIPNEIAKLILLALSILLISFTLYFFRDPLRKIPIDLKEGEILSPADGKVMLIEDIEEKEFLSSKATVIGIFLSPLNVHVNRIPVTGVVKYYRYIKGEFIAAYDHNSAEKNERTEIGIQTEKYKVLFKQIAGFVARRIVCELRVGDKVKIGDKFGMIKFGSRTDVIIPASSDIKVKIDQKVTGGVTILAEVKL
ncbi:MAG: phosphatidylserine decarboxylase family protein [Ignavibacteria bacterium]|nr:phosphatidylserine decarboxylase family protein [Ignavibacteria bacterium]